jgi:DNA-binding beta-propeller fold protein YncE
MLEDSQTRPNPSESNGSAERKNGVEGCNQPPTGGQPKAAESAPAIQQSLTSGGGHTDQPPVGLEHRASHKPNGRTFSRIFKWLCMVLLLDAILGISVGYAHTTTMGISEYVLLILDGVAVWAGRVVLLVSLALVLLAFFHNQLPPELEAEQIARNILAWFFRQFRRPPISVLILIISVALAPYLFLQLRRPVPFLPPASAILIAPSGKELYVANEEAGEVLVYATDSISNRPTDHIKLAKPRLLVMAERRGEIYALDTGANEVAVIDQRSLKLKSRIPVDHWPISIAITPDERKAYISHVPPLGGGKISVISLEDHRLVATITEVNYPEGLAISPDGRCLYVTSQGAAGEFADPVFLVDTRTDKVMKNRTIPNMDVGSLVTVAPNGRKIYVARIRRSPDEPNKISIIPSVNAQRARTLYFANQISSLALTPNSKFLLAGSENQISVIDTDTYTLVETIPLEATPVGFALTKGGWAYVWIPYRGTGSGRIFFRGLSGLEQL